MVRWVAVAAGLLLFAAPSVLFARPMTPDESRCFELSEAVYQASEPVVWDGVEPYPLAEYLSEAAMVDCLGYSTQEEEDIYSWNNYICQ